MESGIIMEVVLTIAGFIFGGGMIGNLIQFFIKRSDDIKTKRKEHYRVIYDKLCDYNNTIGTTLLEYFKFSRKQNNELASKQNKAEQHIQEIKHIRMQIKKQENKCKRHKTDENTCIECNQLRERHIELCGIVQNEIDVVENITNEISNYWEDNHNRLHSTICKYINIHHYFLASKIKDKQLFKNICNIDNFSLEILATLNKAEDVTPNKLIKQLELIEKTLVLLSNKL